MSVFHQNPQIVKIRKIKGGIHKQKDWTICWCCRSSTKAFYWQGAANYFSLTVKQAEEFSSFLTFLGTCENSKGVLHTSVYHCTSASGALPKWEKS